MNAIKNFRRPQNCSEVKSFLGLITFVDRFLVDRATATKCLRTLASASKFYWTEEEEAEFKSLQRNALERIKTLGYFRNGERTELVVDASPVGLGAILVQFSKEEVPRIISCASKALTVTEQKYPQTHREALAVVWGVERFSFYLTGIPFVVRTDAAANEFIFSNNHRIGKRAVSRAEAWALRLQPYDLTIERISSEDNVADALSRLISCSQKAEPFEDDNGNNLLFALDGGMNITLAEIEIQSEQDEEIQQLCLALQLDDWPRKLRPYEPQKKDLHSLGSLVFKADKIVLPLALRKKALRAAHGGHVGEVAMKRVMREFFWWPGMAKETARFVKNCETCTMLGRKNPPVPLSSRELPDGPWEILQIDFLSAPGFGSGEFLIVVDTYSRYLSVVEMHRLTADSTNTALCEIFKLWGCPRILQSDNGPPFQSTQFCNFWEDKGVRVRKSVPLSPQSNGAVERQNQGITKALAASKIDNESWRLALQRYVHHHNTLVPHSRLKVTPYELLVGWKYRGTFPSLWNTSNEERLDRTNVREVDSESKLISKQYADEARGAKETDIRVGDIVLMAQQRKTKTDSTFSSERYTVVAMQGCKVVVMSGNGVQYARNVNDIKKAPMEDQELENRPEAEPQSGIVSLPEEVEPDQTKVGGDHQEQRQLRSRGALKKPARYDEKFVYRVFQ